MNHLIAPQTNWFKPVKHREVYYCQHYYREQYINQTMDKKQKRQFKKHLHECQSCQQELNRKRSNKVIKIVEIVLTSLLILTALTISLMIYVGFY